VSFAREGATSIPEIETRLTALGRNVGVSLLELVTLRDKGSKREVRFDLLQGLHLWLCFLSVFLTALSGPFGADAHLFEPDSLEKFIWKGVCTFCCFFRAVAPFINLPCFSFHLLCRWPTVSKSTRPMKTSSIPFLFNGWTLLSSFCCALIASCAKQVHDQ
jgi:hypothetical protein